MPTNQQLPLAIDLATLTTGDLLCPSTGGMGLNRGVALACTIQAPTTDADLTVTVSTRTTAGLYGGAALVTSDVYVVQSTVYVVPAGQTLRFTQPVLGDAVRVQAANASGKTQSVVVSAEVLGAAS